MPIKLTAPANPGDNDPGNLYSLARIFDVRISLRRKRISLNVVFGNIVDGEWSEGSGLRSKDYVIEGEDYDDFVAKSFNKETVYSGVKRVLYEWLQDHEDRFKGAIE